MTDVNFTHICENFFFFFAEGRVLSEQKVTALETRRGPDWDAPICDFFMNMSPL